MIGSEAKRKTCIYTKDMFLSNYDFTFIYFFLIMIAKKQKKGNELLPRLSHVVLNDFYCCCRRANDNWNPPNYHKENHTYDLFAS